MKLIIKNIVVSLIIIANLAYMTGFTINHHLCIKSKTEKLSINYQSECNHRHEMIEHKETNFEEDLPECCKNNHQEENSCLEEDESCCQNTIQVFSINDDYNFSKNKIEFSPEFKIINSEINNLELVNKILTDNAEIFIPDFLNLPKIYNISYLQAQAIPLS